MRLFSVLYRTYDTFVGTIFCSGYWKNIDDVITLQGCRDDSLLFHAEVKAVISQKRLKLINRDFAELLDFP